MKKFRKAIAVLSLAATGLLPGCPGYPGEGGEVYDCTECTGEIMDVPEQTKTVAVMEEKNT